MSIRTISIGAAFCAAMLFQGATVVAQKPAQPAGDMSAKCKAMMAEHEKMMADMKAGDQRLDSLVAKMNSAAGQAKTDATAAVVNEMVTQHKAMHDMMMKSQQGTMAHMMEHMQAGPESMANCPMMKSMGSPKN